MTETRELTVLQRLFRLGVLVTLCVAPTQWAFELRPKFYLSPADLTLAFTAFVWLLDQFVTRNWKQLFRLPPWPSLLFVALAAGSAAAAPFKALALKDLVQLAEYFLIGHLLFAAYLRSHPQAFRNALWALGAAAGVSLALAAVQYADADTLSLNVRGSFGNRNVLGGFLALALPLVFGTALGVRPLWGKLLLALLLAAGLAVTLSGAAYLAVAAVIVCMAATRGPLLFIPIVTLLLAWQAFVMPRLPRENDIVHFQSVALYSSSGAVERRYPDWQAAYSMVLTHPWLGVGLGNYQKHVGQYYDNIPRQTGPSEPDIQNLYLVLAASAGLPALLAFIALLTCAGQASCRAAKTAVLPRSFRTSLAQGITGSLCAFAITAIWHPLLVRGIGLPLVFLVALAYHLTEAEDVNGI